MNLNQTLNKMKDQTVSQFTPFGEWGKEHLNPRIDEMRCKAFECQDKRAVGFPACSTDHGYEFKTMRQQIQKVQDNLDYKWQDLMIGLGSKSVEEIMYYAAYPYKY